MAYIGMGPVHQVAKKRLFGGPYLHFADFVTVSGYLYQAGALIGRARLDKLMVLARMIAHPGNEEEVIDRARAAALRRRDEYVDVYGEQPTSFPVFLLATEYARVGIANPLRGTGPITESFIKRVAKVAAVKMPLNGIESRIKDAMLEGLGFGSSLPELTEQMVTNANQAIDEEKWSEARQYGLDISETPVMVSLAEQEQDVLSMVATYAQEYFPELVDPLGLSDLVERDGR